MKGLLICATVLAALVIIRGTEPDFEQSAEQYDDDVERDTDFLSPRIYEDKVRKIIENLREELKHCKRMPPFDPWALSGQTVHVDTDNFKMDANFTGLINGLLGFNITDLTISVIGFKFAIGVNFPLVTGKGSYSINGLAGEKFNLYGDGDFDFLIKNFALNANGKMAFKKTGEQQIALSAFTIQAALEQFFVNVTGLMHDEDLSHLISQMLTDSVVDLINTYQHTINTKVSDVVRLDVNHFLVNKTINDFTGGGSSSSSSGGDTTTSSSSSSSDSSGDDNSIC